MCRSWAAASAGVNLQLTRLQRLGSNSTKLPDRRRSCQQLVSLQPLEAFAVLIGFLILIPFSSFCSFLPSSASYFNSSILSWKIWTIHPPDSFTTWTLISCSALWTLRSTGTLLVCLSLLASKIICFLLPVIQKPVNLPCAMNNP